MKRLRTTLVLVCLFSALTFGQSLTSLSGTVTDPTGALIPGAALTLTNTDTGAQRTSTSDAQGRYTFAQIQPGPYKLTAKSSGFNDVVVNDLRLLVNTPATVGVVFEKLGTTSTTVAVVGEAQQVNTVDASVGNA